VEEAMVDVVQRGTGTKARLADYSLFGKTGTSQKMDPDGQYSHTRHISSFVCGAPVKNPRVVVIVTVDEPTQGGSDYGGMVAAPAAADIVNDLLKYMQVPSDHPTQTVEAGAPKSIRR
jgi:cell division protein FtsI/penicillin-binding protein 2